MAALHITNGDGAANLIKASSIEGDVLPWRDPMHHGPFPAGLALEALSELRADYLSGPGIDASEARRAFSMRDLHLGAADSYDEVVLWFEHDLLDQLQILQILDWFSTSEVDLAKLKMICIDRFEGVKGFRGLGELTPEQIASLEDQKERVRGQQLRTAAEGWAAFRSDSPLQLEAFVGRDSSALPFLERALRRHLQEYPWLVDGLTRTERQILKLAAGREAAPGWIFVENMNLEDALFIGDWATFRHMADLCDGGLMLLVEPDGRFRYPPGMEISREEFIAQRLTLSDEGRRVLAGEFNAVEFLKRDMWLGGVHLKSGAPMWMWNAAAGRLELVS